ncbi:leucine-rich repeat-containing protein 51-like [Kryptolebias marmoratus]|uniref:leucine-rich repeat-containing protein 51-like n=1 Tax=Kryptolebias marmoratus TaxID=37003 RepID=UPI0018ACB69E|nr:leucine-rich repeat-containing protein 51-like [Kryptolebias marmoratus]
MYGPPVDFSFKELSNVGGALSMVPRAGLRPLTMNSERKYLSRSIRLSNNMLEDISGLGFVLGHYLVEPWKLGWLDLSFNKIAGIDLYFCQLKELRVLYLHANRIWNLKEVDKLGELKHLHTITLHGNAIENTNGYRKHVILALPHLKSMDFSAVTRDERVLAKLWCKCPKRDKTPEEDNKSLNQ